MDPLGDEILVVLEEHDDLLGSELLLFGLYGLSERRHRRRPVESLRHLSLRHLFGLKGLRHVSRGSLNGRIDGPALHLGLGVGWSWEGLMLRLTLGLSPVVNWRLGRRLPRLLVLVLHRLLRPVLHWCGMVH